jgi:hypothetical protein
VTLLQPKQISSRRDPHDKKAVKALPEIMTLFISEQRNMMKPDNLWLSKRSELAVCMLCLKGRFLADSFPVK